VESFIRLQIYHCVQLNATHAVVFGVTLSFSYTSSSSPAINKFRRLQATSVTCHGITVSGRTDHSTRWSEILAQNRDFCLPHLHSTPPLAGPRRNIAMTFGTEKLEWCGYPMVKKIEDMFIHFDRIHERDGRTDRQTDGHRMTAQAALIARQKRRRALLS